MESFRRAVEIIFNNWSALEIAVNQSGARESTQTILGMIDRVVNTVFAGHIGIDAITFAGKFDDEELIDYLTDTLDDEFNTLCEDGSPQEIVEVLNKLYKCLPLGEDPLLMPEIKKLSASKNWIPTPTTTPSVEDGGIQVTFQIGPRAPSDEIQELAEGKQMLNLSPVVGGASRLVHTRPPDLSAEPEVGPQGKDEEEAQGEIAAGNDVKPDDTYPKGVTFPISPRVPSEGDQELAGGIQMLNLSPVISGKFRLVPAPLPEGIPYDPEGIVVFVSEKIRKKKHRHRYTPSVVEDDEEPTPAEAIGVMDPPPGDDDGAVWEAVKPRKRK